jgi:hypothetical protein
VAALVGCCNVDRFVDGSRDNRADERGDNKASNVINFNRERLSREKKKECQKAMERKTTNNDGYNIHGTKVSLPFGMLPFG